MSERCGIPCIRLLPLCEMLLLLMTGARPFALCPRANPKSSIQQKKAACKTSKRLSCAKVGGRVLQLGAAAEEGEEPARSLDALGLAAEAPRAETLAVLLVFRGHRNSPLNALVPATSNPPRHRTHFKKAPESRGAGRSSPSRASATGRPRRAAATPPPGFDRSPTWRGPGRPVWWFFPPPVSGKTHW